MNLLKEGVTNDLRAGQLRLANSLSEVKNITFGKLANELYGLIRRAGNRSKNASTSRSAH